MAAGWGNYIVLVLVVVVGLVALADTYQDRVYNFANIFEGLYLQSNTSILKSGSGLCTSIFSEDG